MTYAREEASGYMQKGPREAVHTPLQPKLKPCCHLPFHSVSTGDTKHPDSCCHSHPFTSQGQVSLCTETLFIRWLRCALCLAVKNGKSHPREAYSPARHNTARGYDKHGEERARVSCCDAAYTLCQLFHSSHQMLPIKDSAPC